MVPLVSILWEQVQLLVAWYSLFLDQCADHIKVIIIQTLWLKTIIWVIGVLRRTVVCGWHFNNLCGSHLQNQVILLVSWKFKNPGERFDWSIDKVAIGKPLIFLIQTLRKSFFERIFCMPFSIYSFVFPDFLENVFHELYYCKDQAKANWSGLCGEKQIKVNHIKSNVGYWWKGKPPADYHWLGKKKIQTHCWINPALW